MPDLMSGRVTFMFDNLPSALPQARAGKVKALAQTCATRSPSAPDLPTMEEAGFPDFAIEGWYGIFAPARTPRPIVDKLSADINKALKEPKSMESWKTPGLRSDRHHAGGFRRAPEGRPRLLEADDRLHRHQGGVGHARRRRLGADRRSPMDTVAQSRTLDFKPIAPALFAHFVLRSSNMPAMVDWYTTVLNMRVVKRNDFICFLTYDEDHHRLAS